MTRYFNIGRSMFEQSKVIKLTKGDRYQDRLDEKPDLAPDFEYLRSFFHTLGSEHSGMLGPLLSLNTLDAYATRFATAGKLKYGWDIPQSMIDEVKDVNHDLYLMCSSLTRIVYRNRDERRVGTKQKDTGKAHGGTPRAGCAHQILMGRRPTQVQTRIRPHQVGLISSNPCFYSGSARCSGSVRRISKQWRVHEIQSSSVIKSRTCWLT